MTYFKNPTPTLLALMGSPMHIDPHYSQQYASLQHEVFQLQQEVPRPEASCLQRTLRLMWEQSGANASNKVTFIPKRLKM